MSHGAGRNRPRGLVEPPDRSAGPPRQTFVWVFGTIMVLTAGTAFVFKLIEFFHTATAKGSEALASFLIPLLTYLLVAAGFLCLFAWSWLTGQFRDIERAKHRMLEMQEEIDELERAGAAELERSGGPAHG